MSAAAPAPGTDTAARGPWSGDPAAAARSLERARLAAAMDKWATSLVLVRAALDALPDEPAALSLYGLALVRTGGDIAPALAVCRRAVQSQPYAAAWHVHLGEVYRAAGLAPQAAACLRTARALDPHAVGAAPARPRRGRAARWRHWLAQRVTRRATPRPA